MIKSLLHFNNSNNLTKDEGKELTWQVDGATSYTYEKFRSIKSRSSKYIFIDKNNTVMEMKKEG